ncbi:MAG: phosphoribosylamine--glycine ligase [Bacteroidales bacterium]|nr:phosphoribosylamine--glycine ligase [Bacteroidales bacterium]
MNVLVLGSGGREHTIAWKVSKSKALDKLFVAPGNAGTERVASNVDMNIQDFQQVKNFVLSQNINLVIVGPEQPLVDGIVDYFINDGDLHDVKILGPSKKAALLEGSKEYAKYFMKKYNIPTAASASFNKNEFEKGRAFLKTLKPPYVIKADGLAAGKGVVISETYDEAEAALKEMLIDSKFGEASEIVVIEEFLDGIECSVFALTNGRDYQILPVAKDYKRIGERDTGLNTGGMGCVSPVNFADQEFMGKVENRIVKPTIEAIYKEKLNYTGFLFFGLMNVAGDPYVVEYNVRLGDPEAQVVLPRIHNDFLQLCYNAASKKDLTERISINPDYALAVIAASGGYPQKYEKGKHIKGLQDIEDVLVFHAGTKMQNNEVITNGGRVLALTGMGKSIRQAGKKAYDAMDKVIFDKKYYRIDIGKDITD